jgi:hypothetical protein
MKLHKFPICEVSFNDEEKIEGNFLKICFCHFFAVTLPNFFKRLALKTIVFSKSHLQKV